MNKGLGSTHVTAAAIDERSEESSRVGAPKAIETLPPPSGRTSILVCGNGRAFDEVEVTLARRGHPVVRASDAAAAIASLERPNIGLVVVVLPLVGTTAKHFFADARSSRLAERFPVLVVGSDRDVDGGSDAFALGASEYVKDAQHAPDFLATVGVMLGARKMDRHLQYLRLKDSPGPGWQAVVGESPALRRVLGILQQVTTRTQRGATPTILIGGETGTGKGFIAKCVHYASARRNRPFVDVNCAALPASLMEAELFGHERGSFTDAKASRAGLFETADSGTLFLDEIGAVPLDLQAKLLTAIDEKRVRRIGARADINVDVQIIAATHEDLPRKVEEGQFREDLFHRLDVVAVTMPPLRERGTDVVLLAEAFLRNFCREYGIPVRKLTDDARAFLVQHQWPGNVRELRNQLERIVLLENDDLVRVEHFRPSGHATATAGRGNGGANGATGGVVVKKSGTRLRLTLPDGGVSWNDLEREVLREALARCDGNVSRAARFLTMSRQTLIYRMRKYALTGTD